MKEAWGDTPGLQRVWVWAGWDEGQARLWAEQNGVVTNVLLDGDFSVFQSYFMAEPQDAWARNPRHFVIDKDGVLVFAGDTLDAQAEDAVIQQALDDL